VKAIGDLIGMFQTDQQSKEQTVTIEDAALYFALSRAMQTSNPSSGIEFYYPPLVPVSLINDSTAQIVSDINTLHQYVATVAQTIVDLGRDARPQPPVTARISNLKILNTEGTAFLDYLTKVDTSTGQSALGALIRAENVTTKLKEDKSYLFYAKILAAGGAERTRKNLFTGTRVSFSGGLVVSFVVFDKSGKILDSGLLDEYDGYIRVKEKKGELLQHLDQ
jgi:hypothetical protein